MDMKKTLIIGYGNRDREDDGAGWHMLDHIANKLKLVTPELPGDMSVSADGQLKLLYLFQLLPEMAEELSEFERVIFVDAHNSDQLPEITLKPIGAKSTHSVFTHHLSPEELLAIAQTIGKPLPEAWLASVHGHSFRFSRELSDQTAKNVSTLTEQVFDMLYAGDASTTLAGIDFDIFHYDSAKRSLSAMRKTVVCEHACLLRVNGQDWLTFICSPMNLDALAVGFLWNENVIKDLDEIDTIEISDDLSIISITLKHDVVKPSAFHRTSTGITILHENPASSSHSEFMLGVDHIMAMYREFTGLQSLHCEVGGFHSAALCDAERPRIVVEDLGRHNCFDKLSGLFLFQGQPFIPRVITLSGRISSEMVAKSLTLKVPFIISRTSPTSMAIETAQQYGITLIGYLKGNQFEVYSHTERVTLDA